MEEESFGTPKGVYLANKEIIEKKGEIGDSVLRRKEKQQMKDNGVGDSAKVQRKKEWFLVLIKFEKRMKRIDQRKKKRNGRNDIRSPQTLPKKKMHKIQKCSLVQKTNERKKVVFCFQQNEVVIKRNIFAPKVPYTFGQR